ncbi:hypothetical protein V2658_11825 [Tenacibaculum maritimum]
MKYILGWLIYTFGYIFLIKKEKLHIFEAFHILYFIYVLPTITFFSLSNQSLVDFFTLLFPYFTILFSLFNKRRRGKSLPKGKITALFISVFVLIIVLIHYFISTEGNIVLNFSDVYSFRRKYGSVSTSGVFGYVNSWAMKIFSVLFFAWAIFSKNKKMIIIAALSIFLLFALSGHKGALKGVFLVLFFKFLFKRNNRRELVLYGFLGLISVASFTSIYLEQNFIGSLLIRRLLFVPVQLNFTYLEFFSLNEKVFWSNSILKNFITYQYPLEPAFLIGDFLGNENMSANTGFAATGFMHGGYLGVLFYTFIGIFIFRFINKNGDKINKYTLLAITFLPINSLFVSSDLFSTLLTHGLIVSLVILWLYEDKDYYFKFGNKRMKV